MPGLAFLRVASRRAARAAACGVIVAILFRPTESALGERQPYLVKDINPVTGIWSYPLTLPWSATMFTLVENRMFTFSIQEELS